MVNDNQPKMTRQETVSELAAFLAEEGISVDELAVFQTNQTEVTKTPSIMPLDILPAIKSNFELTNELRELNLVVLSLVERVAVLEELHSGVVHE